jgi:NADPH-dependent F420 reductase
MKIAVIGGTGALGAALAGRLARAGAEVLIGSRTADKAQATAERLAGESGRQVGYGANPDVAAQADIIVVTAPFAAQAQTLAEIAEAARGKIVVDTTVPLVPPRVMRVQLPPEGSAAVRAQGLLGPDCRVVSAFHAVAADALAHTGPVDCDVLVFGDDKAARATVIELVELCGMRGLHGGALANSAAAEALTSVLIFINKTYAAAHSGIRITGLASEPGIG